MLYHWALIVACEARHLFSSHGGHNMHHFYRIGLDIAIFVGIQKCDGYLSYCGYQRSMPSFRTWLLFVSNCRHMPENTWIKAQDVAKSSDEGQISGPHLVEVRDVTKSFNEGQIFGPHLVKVRDVTKSSDEGHIFGPYLVEVRDVTKSSNEGHIFWTTLG